MLGQSQITGTGVAKDIPAGIANLQSAADQGDIEAKAALGKILLDGYYTAADAQRGIALLEQAAAAGHAGASLTLGNAYLWGYRTARDTSRARQFLEKASSLGNAEAMRVLGEQLIAGTAWPAEPAAGKSLLEKSLLQGNAKAGVTLGSILLYGTGLAKNRPAALALFEKAATMGDGEGLEIYGEWLMWRNSDPGEAESILRRAAALGRAKSWSILAEGAMYGYLGPHSRSKFPDFAKRAQAAGEKRIDVLEANRQMWGISMRASGPKTIAGLEAAAKDGNADAARFLISLTRDGNHLNIRRDAQKALAYVDKYSALLTPLEAEQFRFSVKAKAARTPAAYRKLSQALAQRPDLLNNWFVRELTAANPNFAVYLLQARLKERGVFKGRINGLATAGTVAVLKAECARLMPDATCRKGILDPSVTAAILLR